MSSSLCDVVGASNLDAVLKKVEKTGEEVVFLRELLALLIVTSVFSRGKDSAK